MRLLLFLFFSLFLSHLSKAQLTDQSKTYTRADTLRGALRPERTCYDVTFYKLYVRLDTAQKSIVGNNKILFQVLEDFQTLQLDLFENMKIISITSSGKELKYRREFNAVFVEMNEPMKSGSRGEITVSYYGQPTVAKRAPWDGGFTWSYDKTGNLWTGVSCEGLGASLWWPCKDYLGDEPDSMDISCNVPQGLRCISNGKELAHKVEQNKTSTYHWFVNYPINSYNVTLNIGDYVSFHDEYEAEDKSALDLDYYVMRYNLEKAKAHFTQVKPMLKCYEKYLGKYPFWKDGYALVETPYLGMEHQGAISYGNKYLSGYAGSDYSRIGLNFDYIIIHETGHEWWGNSVSCRDIADMWIHESFCTYSEAIYVECMFGYTTALKYLIAKKDHVENKNTIVGKYDVNEEGDGDMYNKGALFLNTLRHVVNDDILWWRLIKNMSDTTFKMKNIGYDDVVNYFNQKTGRNLTPIFDQYLKYSKIPTFEYNLKKLSGSKYELSYRWETDVKNFQMPLFISSKGNKKQLINATNSLQSATIKLRKEKDFKVNEDLMYIESKKK
ncbi:MAG: M1 family metallopeptidase [Bacteroidota bacterium]